ncbi:MAG: class B sortase, partial [Ruminiclostridium sp.]
IPDGNTGGASREILPSFKKLLEINPDTVGYIKIEGTQIDYPVVKGKDNDYYLTHDFYKEPSKSGSVMMDVNCKVTADGNSGNLVLYGHNMAVGTFFACLSEYWRTLYDSYDGASIQFYKDHPTITFNTLYEEAEWKIFAIGLYNVDERYGEVYSAYNNKHDFTSRTDFNNFIIDIMDRSDIFTDVDIQYGDDILTLSTCYWPFREDMDNVRLAVFARKVRPGESEYVDVSKAQVNTYVKRWKWVYDNVGGGYDWSQSNWDRRKLLSYTEEDAEKDGYTFIDDIGDDEGIYDY